MHSLNGGGEKSSFAGFSETLSRNGEPVGGRELFPAGRDVRNERGIHRRVRRGTQRNKERGRRTDQPPSHLRLIALKTTSSSRFLVRGILISFSAFLCVPCGDFLSFEDRAAIGHHATTTIQ